MNLANTSGVVLLASALLLGLFFSFVYRRKRRQYILIWSAGCLVAFLDLLCVLLARHATVPLWYTALAGWLLAIASLLFYSSARLYVRRKLAFWGVTLAVTIATGWSLAWAHGLVEIPVALGVGFVFLVVARTFWQEGSLQGSQADVLLAISFVLWGFLSFAIGLPHRWTFLVQWDLLPLMFVPLLLTGVLMVMAVYEEERRRVERNMLALSNINLTTSRFIGNEIHSMLTRTLERVLNVARIPAGVLCLRESGPDPGALVVRGLDDEFCAAMHAENLGEYTVTLAASLGGLVALRDLPRDANWQALEKEYQFRQLRQLLLGQGLRTVVAISLQSKEQVFGALLLGAPDDRRFTPAELRLLLMLGQQIGMSVENSFLVQQTSRRSEELHVLNEIGRALSSTLDLDALLDRICAEMRRLLDVNSFFIASMDHRNQEVRFEIEVAEGERVPKRSRPAGNHLIEYVVRTRQPLLIRDHFKEETRRLGFQSLREVGSICAVPLILYDRPVGVLAVHSETERAFDEEHADLLRALASEAGIAIENARLFSEEQKKSRHLALINNVSRHAISTLNPETMLAKIVAEIENNLTYDHIGVAILDYSTKELVVQAEAGVRREAVGRHILLGEGLIGQVARSGRLSIVREVTPSTPRTVLPGAASAIALPVSYADQLLGVLYVESSEHCDFSDQEILPLRTLADLLAGALHNALTFQKAQEQAITDGLTGVKTHRFLMEALSLEWKRATRANRPFALVLMDLDRFKFVNDFYGHLEGDVVLQRVGHILEQNCRRSDVVARYGGDEFVILMPETSVEQARQLAHKLRGWVASDPLLRDKNITASFGIAGFPVHGATPQELIQIADSSMYLSKHQGGNSVSTAEQGESSDHMQWKKDVLEAYLGVTLKRQFSTGPQAFEEIYRRLEQFTRSLGEQERGMPPGDLPAAVVETVTSLAFAIDAKDPYTQGHSQKVSAYAVLIAQTLRLDPPEIEEIRLAALLHDIGKVGIPEPILNKSGPLDPSELEIMKSHADLGAKVLESLRPMAAIREMIRHHHEFYDGSGYPERLGADRIPRGARIIAIADAYDTITSERVYKKARSPEDAFSELQRCAGAQFDPDFVRIFVEAMRSAPRLTLETGVSAPSSSRASSPAV